MLRRIALLGLALMLSACETMQVTHDYNPAVDFAKFQSWAWKDPAVQYQPNNPMLRSDLTEQRIIQAVGSQLDQRGLRPAQPNRPADLWVSADLHTEKRLREVQDDYGYGAGYGNSYGRYGNQYGMYNSVPVVRTYEVEVMVVRLNLYDGKTGQPVWSSSAETSSKGSLGERSDALRESLNKAVQAYPPH